MFRVNDRVLVRKYGREYPGVVEHVARTGTLKIRFTPNNGNTKVTTVSSFDVRWQVRSYR